MSGASSDRTLWIGIVGVVVGLVAFAGSASSESLEYVSDYYSFVGSDRRGRVAFALDTNRGRDGDEYQAEHFGVLHDEVDGWQTVVGMGAYPNSTRELKTIPDSEAFQFAAAVDSGTIRSEANDLVLAYHSPTLRLSRSHQGSAYRMASGPARMLWRGRVLTGRLIHEWLHLKGSNRLVRTELGLLKDFHGFYLQLGDGDLYLHRQGQGRFAELLGEIDGFVVQGNQVALLDRAEVRVTSRAWARGLYRWPTAWTISWSAGERNSLSLNIVSQQVVSNWVIGGFSMGIVSGEAQIRGRPVSYYGLVELIQ